MKGDDYNEEVEVMERREETFPEKRFSNKNCTSLT